MEHTQDPIGTLGCHVPRTAPRRRALSRDPGQAIHFRPQPSGHDARACRARPHRRSRGLPARALRRVGARSAPCAGTTSPTTWSTRRLARWRKRTTRSTSTCGLRSPGSSWWPTPRGRCPIDVVACVQNQTEFITVLRKTDEASAMHAVTPPSATTPERLILTRSRSSSARSSGQPTPAACGAAARGAEAAELAVVDARRAPNRRRQ